MTNLYTIKRNCALWQVVCKQSDKVQFSSMSRNNCIEWIERNGKITTDQLLSDASRLLKDIHRTLYLDNNFDLAKQCASLQNSIESHLHRP